MFQRHGIPLLAARGLSIHKVAVGMEAGSQIV
jgi:hypothetical protein